MRVVGAQVVHGAVQGGVKQGQTRVGNKGAIGERGVVEDALRWWKQGAEGVCAGRGAEGGRAVVLGD